MRKYRLLHLSANLPGPMAAARLSEMGISVTKIESPDGDPLEKYDSEWYRSLHRAQDVIRLDLKDPAQRSRMEEELSRAHVFMSSVRASSLRKLGLDPDSLGARFPKLHVVLIQGFPAPEEDVPAHDLTCQARAGLLDPPLLPRALTSDFAVAERTGSLCLRALLLAAEGAPGTRETVTLFEMAREFATPWRRGLTTPEGPLGGGRPEYGVYRAKDGWIALAALEPHFLAKLLSGLGPETAKHAGGGAIAGPALAEALARAFALESVAHWVSFGARAGIPLSAVAQD